MRENSNLLEIDMGDLYCLNVGWGDASIIKTDTATFLVDCNGIEDHSDYLPADKNLRGVFITHQHSDHYSGLNYLKDNNYQIDFLIYSPYDRRYGDTSVTLDEWDEFNTLKDHFVSNGTQLRSPFRQDNWEKAWWNQLPVNFWIIGPSSSVATADTRVIHDASLVIKANLGSRACLFAGDASDINLENIAVEVTNYCNDILHASHHGSINGAELSFIKGCNAKYTLISTQTGVYDNAPHPTALRRYSDNTVNDVRRTDIDGTWHWTF